MRFTGEGSVNQVKALTHVLKAAKGDIKARDKNRFGSQSAKRVWGIKH